MSRSITVSAEVEVWDTDLKESGWHHEDDCPSRLGHGVGLDAAIDDLHRQAGHGEFPVYTCTQEPCRSLYLAPAGSAFNARRSVAA